ncbi:hypothetical protein [Noviherbaspirillum massiliense]|uniref:hypothetical protein n=1 Tax=Noviherbaspirillum massiliense TaxID=1465823 RepID=UPI00030E8E7B|nr:hypothetical protein [Noviherbaspirillum massiliense]
MKHTRKAVLALLGALVLSACATVGGTAVGAGIGSMSGNTKNGAIIGGSAGLLYDIFK